MSKLSIYETCWINLVFENRNQEYGAYQLRQESSKTTMLSFFMAILLLVSLGGIYKISSLLVTQAITKAPTIIDKPLIVIPYNVVPITPKTPKTINQASQTKEPTIFLPMVVSATPDAIVEVLTNKNLSENHPVNSGAGNETGVATTTGTLESVATPIDYGTSIVATTALDKLPEFPGGINKFYTYVGNNFEKPEVEGINTMRVLVSFVIEKDGAMTDIQVKRDPGYGLAKEAIRVLKSLKTKWSPGMIGSKAVRTSYSLPITVQMN